MLVMNLFLLMFWCRYCKLVFLVEWCEMSVIRYCCLEGWSLIDFLDFLIGGDEGIDFDGERFDSFILLVVLLI